MNSSSGNTRMGLRFIFEGDSAENCSRIFFDSDDGKLSRGSSVHRPILAQGEIDIIVFSDLYCVIFNVAIFQKHLSTCLPNKQTKQLSGIYMC